MRCYGPLVSELGGAECMVPPDPVTGGAVLPGSAAYVYRANILSLKKEPEAFTGQRMSKLLTCVVLQQQMRPQLVGRRAKTK